MNRKTKIIATIGPAIAQLPTLIKVIEAGVNVFRINASHGDDKEHLHYIDLIRCASKECGVPIPIMLDLQGPKIRLGELEKAPIHLNDGDEVVITTEPSQGNIRSISINFPHHSEYAQSGMQVLIDDGKISLSIFKVEPGKITTKVICGGDLYPHKGVNFPDLEQFLPGFTEQDRHNLALGMKNGIDLLAVSFIRSAQDIIEIRNYINSEFQSENSIPIIAKIELASGLKNIDQILAMADGVMVARGDLAVEISAAKVPIAQKQIIEAANRAGKYVITATQMLESMINNPTPTRAEATDIANAIFDGSDAVMLSGETAVGNYPLEATKVMDTVIREAEAHLSSWSRWSGSSILEGNDEDAYFIAQAAKDLAYDRNVAAICVFTKSGRTAAIVSKTRPPVPVFAFTPNKEVYTRLGIYWGVEPFLTQEVSTLEAMLVIIEKQILQTGLLNQNDQVVVVCGFPIEEFKPPNLALLHTLG